MQTPARRPLSTAEAQRADRASIAEKLAATERAWAMKERMKKILAARDIAADVAQNASLHALYCTREATAALFATKVSQAEGLSERAERKERARFEAAVVVDVRQLARDARYAKTMAARCARHATRDADWFVECTDRAVKRALRKQQRMLRALGHDCHSARHRAACIASIAQRAAEDAVWAVELELGGDETSRRTSSRLSMVD